MSPNEQHSALVLRLSRYREQDPLLQADDDATTETRRFCGSNSPCLEKFDVELPGYEVRRVACARDPYAVMEAYAVHIRLRLARVLGVRMCPQCPRCNDRSSASKFRPPCQDIFGSNMMPMGGLLGAAAGFGGATEYQKGTTPHFHGEVHVICLYQFGTLKDIAKRITEKTLRPGGGVRVSSMAASGRTILARGARSAELEDRGRLVEQFR